MIFKQSDALFDLNSTTDSTNSTALLYCTCKTKYMQKFYCEASAVGVSHIKWKSSKVTDFLVKQKNCVVCWASVKWHTEGRLYRTDSSFERNPPNLLNPRLPKPHNNFGYSSFFVVAQNEKLLCFTLRAQLGRDLEKLWIFPFRVGRKKNTTSSVIQSNNITHAVYSTLPQREILKSD